MGSNETRFNSDEWWRAMKSLWVQRPLEWWTAVNDGGRYFRVSTSSGCLFQQVLRFWGLEFQRVRESGSVTRKEKSGGFWVHRFRKTMDSEWGCVKNDEGFIVSIDWVRNSGFDRLGEKEDPWVWKKLWWVMKRVQGSRKS
jgi:hypothetical protein